MGELARLKEADGLSTMQLAFVELLASGIEPEEAKLKAGYSEATPTVSILRGKAVENAIGALCDRRLRSDLKLKAMKTLDKLMDGQSSQAALGAAKIVLEYGKSDDQGDDKPLSEMTPGELAAMIDRLEREKAARAKDVTPSIGA